MSESRSRTHAMSSSGDQYSAPYTCACGHVWNSGSAFSIRNLAGAVTDTLFTELQQQKAKLSGPYAPTIPQCACCRQYTCHRCRGRCVDCRKLSCRSCWTKSDCRCHLCVEKGLLRGMTLSQYGELSVDHLAGSLRRLHHTNINSLHQSHLLAQLLLVCGLKRENQLYQGYMRHLEERREANATPDHVGAQPEAGKSNSEDELDSLDSSAGTPPPTTTTPSSDELTESHESSGEEFMENDNGETEAPLAVDDRDERMEAGGTFAQIDKERVDQVRHRCNAIQKVLLLASGQEVDTNATNPGPPTPTAEAEVQVALSDLAKIKDHIETSALKELCIICRDASIDCVFLHCGHQVACLVCAQRMCTCPICRRGIDAVLRTYRP